jgi:hypothetical protein
MATSTRKTTVTGTRLATRGTGLIGIEVLAGEAGMHPDLVRRLISLGLFEASGGTGASPLFRRRDAALLMQAARLRRDLGLNYAGAVLACELLARIDELEQLVGRGAPSNDIRR